MTQSDTQPVQVPLGPGIHCDVPEDVYHSDPCEAPSLSSSLARTIISQSVQHAWHLHPRLGGARKKTGKAALEGTILHAIALEQPIPESVCILPHPDYRTKAAREDRDRAIAQGLTPLNQTEYQRIKTQALELREQQERDAEIFASAVDRSGIAYGGVSEVTIIWPEMSYYGTVTCRARLDKLDLESGTIHDLKRVDNAAPENVARKVQQWGYHIQAAAYLRALQHHMPHLRSEFLLHFIEGAPCYGYTPTRLDAAYLELGESLWLRAVEAWGRGIHRGEWPAYVEPGSVHTVTPRQWQLAQLDELDEEVAA